MNIDKYTVKAREALQDAASLAEQDNHSQIEPVHLLYKLLDQEEGIVPPLIEKIGASTDQILDTLDTILDKKPRVTGDSAQVYMSPVLTKLCAQAEKIAASLKDEYVSTEHILLALTKSDDEVGELLRSHGITYDAALRALKDVRGNQRVTSEDPEATFNSLEKYCRDLTELAREEKIDPVIGRDEEIRRVSRVSVKPLLSKDLPAGLCPETCRTACAEKSSYRLTSVPWLPERSSAANLRSASKRLFPRCKKPRAVSSSLSMSCILLSAPVRAKGRWTLQTS